MDRRKFLKFSAAALSVAALPAFASQQGKSTKPNVLLILTDDQGTLDLGCYGAKDIRTPNLDSLAGRGTRFSQFYVAAPVCSPSRAALLTGRYPHRTKITGNSASAKGYPGMPADQITIAEMMKSASYTTGHVGKWHLGYTPETMPNAQGFDHSFGHMGGCIDNYSHFFYWKGPNRHDLWENGQEIFRDGQYFGDLMVDQCKKFITKNKRNPFFLYWAINMPHYPLQAKEKWRKFYKNLDSPRDKYAAFVSTLDEMIGQVLKHLDKSGLTEDTLVIFLSDHGHSEEVRTFSGGGFAGPYRGHKFTLWEGGIRVPCIVSWPGKIPQNQLRDQVAISTDWFPTIAHYCNIAPPKHKIDGKNIAKIISDNNSMTPHDVLHWERKNRWAVRHGDWKLVFNGRESDHLGKKIPRQKYFLTNMAKDVTETKNLAEKHPEIVKQLEALHQQWKI